MAGQRVVAVEHGAHAVRQLITTVQPATARNAIRESLRQQTGDKFAIQRAAATVQALTKPLRALLPVRLIARKRRSQIAASATRRLFQNRRELRGGSHFVIIFCRHQHRRQTRFVAKRRHFLPAGRQAFILQRAELREQSTCRRQIHCWRLVEPGQLARIQATPLQ
ncbi:hypothetical protein D3C86_1561280 [compost metagenome]